MKNLLYFWFFGLLACQSQAQKVETQLEPPKTVKVVGEKKQVISQEKIINYDSLYRKMPDSAMVELIRWDKSFELDIRYATTNNFTGKVLYDCSRCFLRKKTAEDLILAQREFKKLGYRIKIFDGYRPHSVQWKLWNAVTDKRYVSNPKKGSMHNRGCAVDLTLTDEKGKELDMGTTYDFFGKEAHWNYTHLKPEVLKNRQLLKNVLAKYGFGTVPNEWWHYSYRKVIYPVRNEPIPCE